VTASSECYGDVAAFLGDFQLCYLTLALILASRDAVVVVVLRGGDTRVVEVFQLWWLG